MKKNFTYRLPLISLLLLTFLAGCVTMPEPVKQSAQTSVQPMPALRQVPPEKFPVFSDTADKNGFFTAAERSALYFDSFAGKKKFYQVADKKITPTLLADSIREMAKILKESKNENELNMRIKQSFDVYMSAGADGEGKVVFSSYYEPLIEASLQKTTEYIYPIYAKPSDLVEVSLEQFDEQKWKGEKISGRLQDGKVIPYFNREQIDFQKALEGKNLELAWFKTRADIMDLHIQGSGRLLLPDGSQTKARFAATNGLPFKGWMTVLVNSGVMPKEEITFEKAKKYLLEHQDAEPWILSSNRRYTFFELAQIADPSEGPPGTLGIPLVPGRSAAVDPQIFPLGILAYMNVNMPNVNDNGEVLGFYRDSRFVLCQDTGGAILGPGRVDFFSGTGPKSKAFAFNLWDSGSLYIFLLKFPDQNKI